MQLIMFRKITFILSAIHRYTTLYDHFSKYFSSFLDFPIFFLQNLPSNIFFLEKLIEGTIPQEVWEHQNVDVFYTSVKIDELILTNLLNGIYNPYLSWFVFYCLIFYVGLGVIYRECSFLHLTNSINESTITSIWESKEWERTKLSSTNVDWAVFFKSRKCPSMILSC